MEPQTEFKNLTDSYPDEHDLHGYPFLNFVALSGPAFDDFVSRATFKHKGDFSRLHKASQPTQVVPAAPGITQAQLQYFEGRLGRLFVLEASQTNATCRGVCAMISPFQALTSAHSLPTKDVTRMYVLINRELFMVQKNWTEVEHHDLAVLQLSTKGKGAVALPFFEIDATPAVVCERMLLLAYMPPLDSSRPQGSEYTLLFDGNTLELTDPSAVGLPTVFVQPIDVGFVSETNGVATATYPNFRGMSGSALVSIANHRLRGIHTEGLFMHHSDKSIGVATETQAKKIVSTETQAMKIAEQATTGRRRTTAEKKHAQEEAAEPLRKRKLSWNDDDWKEKGSLSEFQLLGHPDVVGVLEEMQIPLIRHMKTSGGRDDSLYGDGDSNQIVLRFR